MATKSIHMYKPPFQIHHQRLLLNFNDWLRTDNSNVYISEGIDDWSEMETNFTVISCYRDPVKNQFEIDLKITIGYPGKASPFSQLTTKVVVQSGGKKEVENVLETVGLYVFNKMDEELSALNLRDKLGVSFTIPPLGLDKEQLKVRFWKQRYNLHFKSHEELKEYLKDTNTNLKQNMGTTLSSPLSDDELKWVLEKYNPVYDIVSDT